MRTLAVWLAFISAGALCATAASAASPEERPDWTRLFEAEGTRGVIVVYDAQRDRAYTNDPARAAAGFRPKSTFKIPNALFALETGVAQDADHPVFTWDGVRREIAAWNQDHTLRSAFKVSAVPVFQEIARRIGAERMQAFIDRLAYGNRALTGAPLDRFWLDGDLRISAHEQVALLRRLYAETLPFSARSQRIVKDIMLVEEAAGVVLRGKTGASLPGEPDAIGWFVGWEERAGSVRFFALNLDLTARELLGKRIAIANAALATLPAP